LQWSICADTPQTAPPSPRSFSSTPSHPSPKLAVRKILKKKKQSKHITRKRAKSVSVKASTKTKSSPPKSFEKSKGKPKAHRKNIPFVIQQTREDQKDLPSLALDRPQKALPIDKVTITPIKEHSALFTGSTSYICKATYKIPAGYTAPPWVFEKHKHQEAIQKLSPAGRFSAYIDWAHFYVQSGFSKEALSILTFLQERYPYRTVCSPDFFALSGLVHFIEGNYTQALQAFTKQGLEQEEEIACWIALCHLGLGHPLNLEIHHLERYLPTYAEPVQLHLLHFLLPYTLAINDKNFTQKLLNFSETLFMLPESKEFFDLYKVHFSLKGEPENDAQILSEIAQKVVSNRVYAQAFFAEIEALLKGHAIENKEALQRLCSIAFFVRGQPFEQRYYTLLASLHEQNGDLLSAIKCTCAVLKGPNSEDFKAAQEHLPPLFHRVIQGKPLAQMDALMVLQFFYDVKAFLVQLPEKALILTHFGDQFLRLGLKRKATEAYISAAQATSTPAAKARGLLLGLKALLERRKYPFFWEMAEKIPDYILSESDKVQLKVLKANAYTAQKDYKRALAILKGVNTKEAFLAYSEIYLHLKDRPHAISSMEAALPLLKEEETVLKDTILLELGTLLAAEEQERNLEMLIHDKHESMSPITQKRLKLFLSSLKMQKHHPLNRLRTPHACAELLEEMQTFLKNIKESL
jgi:hypothetical protein